MLELNKYIFFIGLTTTCIILGAAIYLFVLYKKTQEKYLRNKSYTQEIEEKNKLISDLAFEGLLIHQNGKIIDLNNTVLELFGYESADEMCKLHILDIAAADCVENIKHRICKQINDKHITNMLRKDGSTFPAEVNVKQIDYKGEPARFLAIRDITERIESEKKLYSQKERLAVTLSSIGDGVIATDQQGIITLINAAAEELTGWNSKKAIGKHISEVFKLIDEKTKEHRDGPVDEVLATNKITGLKRGTMLISKKGKELYISTTASPIKNENNETQGVVLAFRDVSRHRKTEDELSTMTNYLVETNEELLLAHSKLAEFNLTLEDKINKRTKEVEDLIKQKDEFISQLGHDLKTPLTPLVGLLPLIRDMESDPQKREMLDVVVNSANYMKDLVFKTLMHAKVNTTKSKINLTNINIKELIIGIAADYRFISGNKHISIEHIIDPRITVEADYVLLQELIRNLIDNSIKYSSENPKIRFFVTKEEGFVKISMSDNGIGMTEENIQNIFNEFYKVDDSRHDLTSSGLGLSICKRIIDKHCGKIWAESQGKGMGSTFHFTLPDAVDRKLAA